MVRNKVVAKEILVDPKELCVNRVVFARVGWMTYYAGPQPGDERPQGGGAYTKSLVGHEAFNFYVAKHSAERIFAFMQHPMASLLSAISLERIAPEAEGQPFIDNVTVIWVSRNPGSGGQRIVGWFKNARVHRQCQVLPRKVSQEFAAVLKRSKQLHDEFTDFNVECAKKDACLLPVSERAFDVPGGITPESFGQSNVFYTLDSEGNPKRARWIRQAIEYIQTYSKENLLLEPHSHMGGQNAEIAMERAAGFQSNPAIRNVVEEYAMGKALQVLNERGFTHIRDTHRNCSYDYTGERDAQHYFIEVKGTQTEGTKVILTRLEVDHAKLNGTRAILILVHSIEVSTGRLPKASKGTVVVFDPWELSDDALQPIAFTYTVPSLHTVVSVCS
jgi:hypothetical protein